VLQPPMPHIRVRDYRHKALCFSLLCHMSASEIICIGFCASTSRATPPCQKLSAQGFVLQPPVIHVRARGYLQRVLCFCLRATWPRQGLSALRFVLQPPVPHVRVRGYLHKVLCFNLTGHMSEPEAICTGFCASASCATCSCQRLTA
jgi:hypothetical protein